MYVTALPTAKLLHIAAVHQADCYVLIMMLLIEAHGLEVALPTLKPSCSQLQLLHLTHHLAHVLYVL
eukprot:6762-Heterococcus_DN1.PRE.3